MLKQNKIKKVTIIISIIVFIFFLFNFSNLSFLKIKNIADAEEFNNFPYRDNSGSISIIGNAIWTKDTPDLVFDEPVYVENGATLTIKKGTVIKFKKAIESNAPPGIFVTNGKIIANGTQGEHIKFTSDQDDSGFVLNFYDRGERTSFLRYVEISKGGNTEKPILLGHLKSSGFFINTVYAYDSSHPVPETGETVLIGAGKVHIENSFFHNNKTTDILIRDSAKYDNDYNQIGTYSPEVEVINSNFSKKSSIYSNIACSKNNNGNPDKQCAKRVYLKDNWYGDSAGPTEKQDSRYKGAFIGGIYTLDSFRKNKLVVDPVIIIPGIMGSARVFDKWKLDPILHTYDNLVESLKENSYEENKNLFEFPYEWRDSNIVTAGLLKNKIQEVKSKTKISKVDLVAHSMGGLVARYYIESSNYQNDVEKLITLGTPQYGAPESYLEWEAGEGFFTREEKIGKFIFTVEAHEAGYNSLKKYIQSRIKSVGELLPDYNYLKEASTGKMRSYPNNYPKNIFLDFLNKQSNLKNLKSVNFFNIIGKINSERTIKSFDVVDSTKDGKWENGMPKNYYDVTTNQGIEYGKGDGTVPLESAEGIASTEKEMLSSSHIDLPTEAQCDVIIKLTGRTNCNYINTVKRVIHILIFGVFSPIDIQVVAPDGKRVGKDFDNLGKTLNEISGAYYTGYETDNEFLTIPNPQDGEYKVITQGTGAGDYKVAIANISEDRNNPGQATEVTAEITGTTEEGKIETTPAEITENKITVASQDTIPPTIKITSPKNKTYLNNQSLKIIYTANDNLTIPDKIKTTLIYDNQLLTSKKIDLSLEHLGRHHLKIIAQDEAKNKIARKVNFKIATNLKAIGQNIYHYRKLKLIKNQMAATILEERISHIQRIEELSRRLEKKWFPAWWKKRINRHFQLQKDQQIKFLIKMIIKSHYLQKNITKSVRIILVEDLRDLEKI